MNAWLDHTPMALLRAHVAMLPRLQAEERLARINDGSAAQGLMTRRNLRRFLAALERAAAGTRRERVKKAAPNRAALAAMGIAMVEAPSAPVDAAEREDGHG